MPSTVLYMSMSLDGFVAGPNESWDENPLGDDGGYLHGWFPPGAVSGDATAQQASEPVNSEIFAELNATGAIVAGAGPSMCSSSMSSRCCSDRDAGCSTASHPSTRTSNAFGSSKASVA